LACARRSIGCTENEKGNALSPPGQDYRGFRRAIERLRLRQGCKERGFGWSCAASRHHVLDYNCVFTPMRFTRNFRIRMSPWDARRVQAICYGAACLLVLFATATFAQNATKKRADTARFAKRVDVALAASGPDQGFWGVLVTDADSGEVLYELNADRHF